MTTAVLATGTSCVITRVDRESNDGGMDSGEHHTESERLSYRDGREDVFRFEEFSAGSRAT